ncbi:MAG: hypothetical protein UDB11_00555 [Peptococcaceae bacterium]|nr:hypothetical protein [Peptococcaceae bacterium]
MGETEKAISPKDCWVTERMRAVSGFDTKLMDISCHIIDTDVQREKLDELRRALKALLETDACVLAGIYKEGESNEKNK